MVTSATVSGTEFNGLRQLLDDAFDHEFSDDDWDHALGGWHAIVSVDGVPVSHAAVVPRRIEVGARVLSVGYVEAVATAPGSQRQGHALRAMRAAMDVIRLEFEMGVLSTGHHRFYGRLGWERWQGPSFVIEDGRRARTADEDDSLMVLRFGPSADVPLDDTIACWSRPGDDW